MFQTTVKAIVSGTSEVACCDNSVRTQSDSAQHVATCYKNEYEK